ncbi:MAG: glycosyltransferase family 39 protein [Candidatus Sumerlaeota bacterium]|nr:glycosyltransferase family 39 protein [Candidatus Sumerlaeota bacterium]
MANRKTRSLVRDPAPADAAPDPSRIEAWGGWAVVAAALAARAAHWAFVRAYDPLYAQTFEGFDTRHYIEWAQKIAAGDWLSRAATDGQPFFYGPLYPYFLGIVFRFFGESFDAVHILQALIGILPPYFVWLTGKRLFGPQAALAAGLLAALCAPIIFYEQTLLSEGLILAVNAALIWAFARGCEIRDSGFGIRDSGSGERGAGFGRREAGGGRKGSEIGSQAITNQQPPASPIVIHQSSFVNRLGWAIAAGILSGLACWGKGNFLLLLPLMAWVWTFTTSRKSSQNTLGTNIEEQPQTPNRHPLPPESRITKHEPRSLAPNPPPQTPATPRPPNSELETRNSKLGTRNSELLQCAGAYILAATLMLSLTLWRNYHVSGKPVLLTSNGALNLFLGNVSDTLGVTYYTASYHALIKQYGDVQSVPWLRELRRDVAAHPGAFAALSLKKSWMFLNSYETPDNANYYANKRYSPILRWNPISWLTLAPLAAIGIWRTRATWRRQRFLYIYSAGFAVSIIMVLISGRYRLPLMLPMALWGGAALVGMIEDARARRINELTAAGAVMAAGILLLWPAWSPAVTDNARRGKTSERPLIRDIDYFSQGQAHLRLGQKEPARAWFNESVEHFPLYTPPYSYLALFDIQDGKPQNAVKILERYATCAGQAAAPDMLLQLAEAYLRNRRPDLAQSLLRRVVMIYPDNSQARRMLEALENNAPK